jgi:protein-S-isoprenylcysteine O-methyltransferase Ste14
VSVAVGVLLVFFGRGLRAWAHRHLRVIGEDRIPVVLPIVKLVETGPYAYLNHPLYVGALIWIAGLGVVCLGWGGFVVALAAVPFYMDRMLLENSLVLLYKAQQPGPEQEGL